MFLWGIYIKHNKFKVLLIISIILSIVMINSVCACENETQINATVDDNLKLDDTQIQYDFNSIQKLINDSNPGDSIHLENKTYYGNGTAITINKNISIYGSELGNTVLDANDLSGIFIVPENFCLNVVGITFTKGHAEYGGAINNDGKLSVLNSTFTNNYAWGGTISGSTKGDINIEGSVFTYNRASNGACIYNYQGNLRIVNSTFMYNNCNEGSIYNLYAPCLIYNSTFMNNTAERGGGVYNNKGNMKIYNSKFLYNHVNHLGGGIKSFGDCEVHDSIIKSNTGYQGGGLFVSQNKMKVYDCIVEDNVAYEGGGFFADVKATLIIKNTRIINNSAQTDGGGINVYQGLLTLSDSILINNDAAKNGGGLFYSDYPYYSNIKNLIFINNSAKLGGGIYVGTTTVKITNASIESNTAHEGGGIYNNGYLSLDTIKLTSNNADNGGGIYSSSDLTLSNSQADDNYAAEYGGAIYNLANVSIEKVSFTLNGAGYGGGVIYNENGAFIKDSLFSSNFAGEGGVLYSSGDLIIDNSQFIKNYISHSFGALFLLGGDVNITNSVFDSTKGSDEGGAIYNCANLYINNSQFKSNTVKSHGAGIDNNANLIVENSLFYNNKAYGGGAIDNGGNLIIIKSNFTNNKATANGGAIDNNGNMTVVGSIFENNAAEGDGGAIIARRGVSVNYSIFYNNADKNSYSIFNDTWDEINISNNWWGCNNPNFENLLNFNISDEFNWIVMGFTNATPLIQDKKADVIITFNEFKNKAGGFNSIGSLPVFKVRLSNGDVIDVEGGYASRSVSIPSADNIAARMNDQIIALNVSINTDNIKRIIGNKDMVADYGAKTTFKVRVIGDDLRPVAKNVVIVMKISGKSYNVKTDGNGYASKVFSLTPGKYSITASYKGYSVKNTITVKNVLIAKSAIKKKSKKIKYSARLKTSNGKAIVGKKITFKINGKTYSAKTDKKGIASVSFKNLKAGSYRITVGYLKSQVKTTLKVKR